MAAVWVVASCALLLGAAAPADGKRAAAKDRDANRLTGILKSIDVKRGTLTIERVGVDVDDALSERLKARGKDGDAAASPDPAQPADGKPADDAEAAAGTKPTVVTIGGKTKLYIKFRSSPSSSNHLERTLKDLEPMVGWPVTVVVGSKDEPVIVAEVIAWRGTPWKVSR